MRILFRLLLLPPALLLFLLSLVVFAYCAPLVPLWAYLVASGVAALALCWWIWGRRRPPLDPDSASLRDRFDSTGKGLL